MSNPRSASELSAKQLGTISWFISFGDLLTLLVCFFLLLTPRFANPGQQTQGQQGVSNVTTPRQIPGTTFASRSSDVKDASGKTVPVWRRDPVVASSGESLSGAQAEWLRLLIDNILQGATATVSVCEAESESEVISEALEKLQAVGESASQVTFQLGAQCEQWRKRFVSERQLVAVVQFSWK
jgi:hypothetical protein